MLTFTALDLKQDALNRAGNDLEKAKSIFAWLIEGDDAPPAAVVTNEEKAALAEQPEPKKTRSKKAETPPADKGDTGVTTPKTDAKTLDYASEVRPHILTAVAAIGRDKVLAVIQSHGAEKAQDVDPAKWPALILAVQKEVKAETGVAA